MHSKSRPTANRTMPVRRYSPREKTTSTTTSPWTTAPTSALMTSSTTWRPTTSLFLNFLLSSLPRQVTDCWCTTGASSVVSAYRTVSGRTLGGRWWPPSTTPRSTRATRGFVRSRLKSNPDSSSTMAVHPKYDRFLHDSAKWIANVP